MSEEIEEAGRLGGAGGVGCRRDGAPIQATAPDLSFSRREIALCAAFALLLVGSYVLNRFVFPSVAVIFPAGREISTFGGAAASIVFAIVAFRRPGLIRESLWSAVALALFGCSMASLAFGIASGNEAVVAAGSPFGGISQVWFLVLVGVALARAGLARSTVLVPAGFAIAYFAQGALEVSGWRPGYGVACALYFACVALSYLLMRPMVSRQLDIICQAQAPAVLDTTNPHSFLPLGSLVFVCVWLFNAASGFALGSGMGPLGTAMSLAPYVPVLGLFFVMVAMRRPVASDRIYLLATVLVLGGLLLAPLRYVSPAGIAGPVAVMALQGGTDCFSLLTYLLIAAIGARNPVGSLSVSASMGAASYLGIACGAPAVQGVNELARRLGCDVTVPLLCLAALTFAFVVFNLVSMKPFSFDALIRGIEPVPEELVVPPALAEGAADDASGATDVDARCDVVAARYQLTPRERDVLGLLARGRTSPIIQERLVVSQNTVRTHVRHIYTKLGVHSQQELINLVDEAGC